MSFQSFQDLLSPISLEDFESSYFDQSCLYVKGEKGRFKDLMSWDILSDLLNREGCWSSSTLQLAAQGEMVPIARYCQQGRDRQGQLLWIPDKDKVRTFLRQGMTLVCNDVSAMTAELRHMTQLLTSYFGAQVQANLYCSWENHPGFKTHFDTHDVMVLHIAGQKTWHLYKGRHDNPIAHPMFKNFGQAHHDQARGEIEQTLTLEPGDFLYVPRGVYHDALADSPGTLHITFGLTYPMGLDLLSQILEQGIKQNVLRQPMRGKKLESYLKDVHQILAQLTSITTLTEIAQRLMNEASKKQFSFTLPKDVTVMHYAATSTHFQVVMDQGQAYLQSPKGRAPIPVGLEDAVHYMIQRPKFTEDDVLAHCSYLDTHVIQKLVHDLIQMRVIHQMLVA